MAKKSRKQYYNELSRDLTCSGPVLCRTNLTLYAFRTSSDEQGRVPLSLPANSTVILFRGPLPSGEHKTKPGGGFWLLYSFGFGACFIDNTFFDFDTMFKRV